MKKIAFPLLLALGFLMISSSIGSAQINVVYPYNVSLTLDTASLTYDLNQTNVTPVTIHGTIQDNSTSGHRMTINISTAKQWVISTKIDGAVVQNGETMTVSQGQTSSVEISVIPYAETPDTESYCLGFSMSPTYGLGGGCVTLLVTNTSSAVNPQLPTPKITTTPNPAGNYVIVSGLSDAETSYRYEIFSISGAEVRHGLLPSNARINVQDIPSGAYRLIVSDAKGSVSNTGITVVH